MAFNIGNNRNVIIIEDQDSLREALAQMVKISANHTVAGTFPSVASALHSINSTSAPIILLDVHLGDEFGIDGIREIKCVNPYAKVVMLSSDSSIQTIIEAFRMGADGYLLKEDAIMMLGEYLRNLGRYDSVASPGVVSVLILHATNPRFSNIKRNEVDLTVLTKTQRIILSELSSGADYQEISQRVGSTRNTVNQHVQHIYRKLGVSSRAELMAKLN